MTLLSTILPFTSPAMLAFTHGTNFGPLRLDDRTDPRFLRLADYWSRLDAAQGGYPARSAIDPTKIDRDLMSRLFIVDVVREPDQRLRFRFRLLGQDILDLERIRRGVFLDEIAKSPYGAEAQNHYEDAANGVIRVRRSNLGWLREGLDSISYSVLLLPLSDEGTVVTHLLGLCLYDKW